MPYLRELIYYILKRIYHTWYCQNIIKYLKSPNKFLVQMWNIDDYDCYDDYRSYNHYGCYDVTMIMEVDVYGLQITNMFHIRKLLIIRKTKC